MSIEADKEFKWVRECPGHKGKECLSVGKSGSLHLIRYRGVADYLLSHHDSTVRWKVHSEGSDEERAVHLGMNQVIPMILSTQNRLLLHASCVTLNNGAAIAFSGPSGIGKSTLAKALSIRPEIQALADDWISIALSSSVAFASAYSQSICDTIDSTPSTLIENPTGDKLPGREFRVHEIEKHRSEPHPLGAIYLLEAPEKHNPIKSKKVPPKTAYVDVARNLFRLDPSDHKQLQKELRLLLTLLQSVPVFSLSYPRELDQLSSLTKHVLANHAID